MASKLDLFGIDPGNGERGRFDLEVCCSQYLTSQILVVVNTCLIGKQQTKLLFRAQEMGWSFFAPHVRRLLQHRQAAWQQVAPDQGLIIEGWSHKVYSIVMSAFALTDVGRPEVNDVLFRIPHLCNQEGLVLAIAAAKERKQRSIPYLRGILERDRAQRVAERDERLDSTPIWQPPTEREVVDIDSAVRAWERAQRTIDLDVLFPHHA